MMLKYLSQRLSIVVVSRDDERRDRKLIQCLPNKPIFFNRAGIREVACQHEHVRRWRNRAYVLDRSSKVRASVHAPEQWRGRRRHVKVGHLSNDQFESPVAGTRPRAGQRRLASMSSHAWDLEKGRVGCATGRPFPDGRPATVSPARKHIMLSQVGPGTASVDELVVPGNTARPKRKIPCRPRRARG